VLNFKVPTFFHIPCELAEGGCLLSRVLVGRFGWLDWERFIAFVDVFDVHVVCS
jgi:hypothetical protein